MKPLVMTIPLVLTQAVACSRGRENDNRPDIGHVGPGIEVQGIVRNRTDVPQVVRLKLRDGCLDGADSEVQVYSGDKMLESWTFGDDSSFGRILSLPPGAVVTMQCSYTQSKPFDIEKVRGVSPCWCTYTWE